LKNLIFIGAPGSGKGSQAKLLTHKYTHLKHVSTGDLLRSELSSGSELASKIQGLIHSGQLVDDDVVMQLLKKNCDLKNQFYLFDGFPRNLAQARLFSRDLIQNENLYQVIYFQMDIEKTVARLTSRLTCGSCSAIYNTLSKPPQVSGKCDLCGGQVIKRKDDEELVIRSRFKVFLNEIESMLEYYQTLKILKTIDASLSVSDVSESLEKVLEI
jgi:adenylate kinase